MKRYLALLGAGVLSVLILLGGVLLGWQINKQPSSAATAVTSGAAPVTEYAEPVGSIAIPGYATITLKSGKRTQSVTLVNPAENECYFVISLLLPDGTEVYKSGLIAPGSNIDSIRLATLPEQGTYNDAILRYTCWSAGGDGALVEINRADTICILEVKP